MNTAAAHSAQVRADLLLLLTALIWGFAFVAQRARHGARRPLLLQWRALRPRLLAAFALCPANHRRTTRIPPPPRPPRRPARRAFLFTAASLQQVGIVYTTAGKAGFITGLYVILVPILGLLLRHRSRRSTWTGALVATSGLYLLSVEPPLTIAHGDALVLVSAFFWAGHVLVIGSLSRQLDWAMLAFLQFFVCALLSMAVALGTEHIALQPLVDAAVPVFYGGVMSVGVAYTLQVVAQRRAAPGHAAIILSLETVFAALGGWLLLDEEMPLRGLVGCGLMFVGC